MATILVTGATGALGREVVRRLLERRQTVRAFVRNADARLPDGVTAFPGDIRSGEGLDPAIDGVDAVIHCATFFDAGNVTDLAGAHHLIAAAARHRSPHLVYISIVGIDGSAFSYFQGKRAIEGMIESSGLPFTIQRAAQFHDFVLKLISSFEKEATSTIKPPAGLSFQSIDVSEVADALAALALGPPRGRAPDIAGPEILTLEEMAEIYARIRGKSCTISAEPDATPSDFHDAFRSGRSLAPERRIGQTTWEAFLRRCA